MKKYKGKPVIYKNDELCFIGAAIAYHRMRKGITQSKMASILNLSLPTYAKRENQNKFTPEQLDILAKHLNLNIKFTIQELN